MRYLFICLLALSVMPAMAQDSLRVACQDKTHDDINKTIAQFKGRIRAGSSDIHLYYELGMSYYKLHKPDTAIAYFDTVISLNPHYGGVFLNRGICKMMQHDKDGACEDFKKCLSYDKDYDGVFGGKSISEYVKNNCQ